MTSFTPTIPKPAAPDPVLRLVGHDDRPDVRLSDDARAALIEALLPACMTMMEERDEA